MNLESKLKKSSGTQKDLFEIIDADEEEGEERWFRSMTLSLMMNMMK